MKPALALKCKPCGLVFPNETAVGMIEAHFLIEHETDQIRLDLAAFCSKCQGEMSHLATMDDGRMLTHHYVCEPCHRPCEVRQRK